MKKGLIIGIVIIVVVIIIGVLAYPYINNLKNKQVCAKLGENSYNDAKGTVVPCCEGLEAVSPQSGKYDPTNKYADKDGCIWADGYGSYCSDKICGNGICDSDTENRCTCPKDCANNETTQTKKSICGNGICEAGEGPACLPCNTPGICTPCPAASCPQDCAVNQTKKSICGNGICEAGEQEKCNPGEICPQHCAPGSCPQDCKYSCPENKTIDCMPSTDSVKPMCSGEYHDWIVKNCNVIFAL
jgi:hypothetical protein